MTETNGVGFVGRALVLGLVLVAGAVIWMVLHPTEASCEPTGDLVLQAVDLERLSACLVAVPGTLRVAPDAALDAVELRSLRSAGAVVVEHPVLVRFTAPALETIKGELRIAGSPQLAQAHFQRLREAGSVRVENNPALTELRAPELTVVDESLLVRDCTALPRVRFPQLVGLGGVLRLEGLAALRQISLPVLERAFELVVRGCPNLFGMNMPQLDEAVPRTITDDAEPQPGAATP